MKYQMEDLSEWQRIDGVNHPNHHAPLNQSQVRAYAVVRGTANSDLGPLYTQAASSEYDAEDVQHVDNQVDIRRDAKESIDDRLYGKTCLDTATTTATVPPTFSEDESHTPLPFGKDSATPLNSPSATHESGSKADMKTIASSDITDQVISVVVDIKSPKFKTPVLNHRVVQVAPPTPYSLNYHDVLRMEYVNRQLPFQSPTPGQKPSSVTEAMHAQYAADLESYELSPFPDSRQATSVTDKSQVFTLSDYEEESLQSIAGNTTECSKTVQDSWSIPICQYPKQVVAMYAGLTSEVDGDSLRPGVRDYQGHFQSVGAGPADLLKWSEGALKDTEKIHLGTVFADQTGPLFTATPGRDKTAELPKQVTYIGQLDEQDARPMTPFVPDPDDHPIPLRSPIGVDMDYMPKTFARMNPKLYAQHERSRRIEESGQDVRYVKIAHQADSDTGKEADIEVYTSDDVFDAFENPGVGKYKIVSQAWNDVGAALQKNADLLDAASTAKAHGIERCDELRADINNLREYFDARAMADVSAQHNRMLCRYAKIRQTFLQAYHARLDFLARSATTASDMQAAAADMEDHLGFLGGVFENMIAEFDMYGETLAQAAAYRYVFGEENAACSGGATYARRMIQPAVYSMEEWVVTSCQDGAVDILGRPVGQGQVLPNSLVPNGHAFINIDSARFVAPGLTPEKPLTVPVSTKSPAPSMPIPSIRPSAFAKSAPDAAPNPADSSALVTAELADLVTGPRIGAYDRSLTWNCHGCGNANYGLGLMCDHCGADRNYHTSDMVEGSSEYRTTADLKRLAQASIAPLRIRKTKASNQTAINSPLNSATNLKLNQDELNASTFSRPSNQARHSNVVDRTQFAKETLRQSSDVSVMGNKSLSLMQHPSARRQVNSKVFLYNGSENDSSQDFASTALECRRSNIVPFDPRGRPLPATPAKVQRVEDVKNHVETSHIEGETYPRVVPTFL